MIKMLIVDDEYIILESLKNLLDWQSVGVEVVGALDNGAAAVDFTFKQRPDIILSDISMPLFGGLEMLETLRKNNLDTEVIFISAHSNFEYAREALKHGAFDYILKPLNEALLLETVKRCAEKIAKKQNGSKIIWRQNLESGASRYYDRLIGGGRAGSLTAIEGGGTGSLAATGGDGAESFQTACGQLLLEVKAGDEKAAEDCLFAVFAGLAREEDIFDADLVKLKCVKLLDDILRGLEDYRLPDYLGNPLKVLSAKKNITAVEILDDVVEATRNMIVNLTLCVKEVLAASSRKLVSLAISYIQENYQKDISLPQIAEHLYISPTYLSRIFSLEMKIPFSSYLRNYRIDIAKKLLRESRLKIYEVAVQVGYSDVAHFSKSFKQITGVTPIHYREEPHV